MYKKIRKSVADAIATVEDPEQFQWSKWLKEPQIYLERFPKPRINISNVENFSAFELPSLYQVKKFTLTKFKISEQIRNVIIPKKKSFKIFFTFPKTYPQKITIFNPDTVRLCFLSSVFYKEKKIFLRTKKDKKEETICLTPKCKSDKLEPIEVIVKKYCAELQKVDSFKQDCLVTKPELSDCTINLPSAAPLDKIVNLNVLRSNPQKKYLAISFNPLKKKPKLKNIPIIAIDQIMEQLDKSGSKKIRSVPIEALNEKAKHYKVKLAPLDKLGISLYHLKNLHAQEAKLNPFKFTVLEKASINKIHNKEQLPKLKISNPGILSELIPIELEEPKKKLQKIKVKKEDGGIRPQKVHEKIEEKKINLEKVEDNIAGLLPYQKEGIKLLLSNKTVLLSDELGLDKKSQTIHALYAAIKQGVIKKALIVCPHLHIGDKKVCQHIKNSEGWENQIYELDTGLNFATIKENNEYKAGAFKDTEIFIIDYDTLIDWLNNTSMENIYSDIECLILDEAQYLVNNHVQTEKLFNFPQCKYQWVLTSLPSQIIEERLIPKLRDHLVGFEKIDASLNRTKQTLGNILPSIVRNDFWPELDLEQLQEFENTLLQGQKRIFELVKSGNPFIIQSNIFTLIHQIKQLSNFSAHKETSPKSELLLDQLESIIASGKKCIIFSQYDKQGIQKIERLLKSNQIRYVLYQSGVPLKELENSANTFRKEGKISVMLAGLTAASVKVKIPEASYLIHFDQWWNPIAQWHYEDKTMNSEQLNQFAESVNVINYFGNNFIEINIRETLRERGLLTKNLMEFLSNETIYSLISNEDWLDILGIEHTRSMKNQKPDIDLLMGDLFEDSLDNIGRMTKTLFTKFGYKNLVLKPDMLHEELTIYGTASKGLNEIKTATLCLPFKTKDLEPVETFIREASKNNCRLFVICSEEIVNQIANVPQEKVTYIGQRSFANYIAEFKIN